MLWFGKLAENSLINSNQIRNFGIELYDNPYSDGDFGITFASTFIPFDVTGTIVYFESRVPTKWEEKHLPVILLTAEVWDPPRVQMGNRRMAEGMAMASIQSLMSDRMKAGVSAVSSQAEMVGETNKIDHKEQAAAKLFISELPREPEDTLFEPCINKFATYVSRAFQNQKADSGRGDRQGRGRGGRGFSSGRSGHFGHGGGHGRGRGGDFKSDNVSFNGVDCSDIHQDFSADEWQKLGPVGRKFIHEKRKWKKKNGGQGNQQSVNAVTVNDETSVSELRAPTTNNSNGQRGTQNCKGFGKGAQKK